MFPFKIITFEPLCRCTSPIVRLASETCKVQMFLNSNPVTDALALYFYIISFFFKRCALNHERSFIAVHRLTDFHHT